jgi:hypothetical protein
MTITLTRDEAQQVLDAVNTAYGAACFEAAKILRSKLSEPNIVQDAIVYGTGITKDGKRIDPASIYKESEPEPVAYLLRKECGIGYEQADRADYGAFPVYTAPPQRERAKCDGGTCGLGGYCDKCPKAQPEPEPVAWRFYYKNMWSYVDNISDLSRHKFEPLYTAQPQREWQGLTDEEIRNEANHHVFDESFFNGAVWARGKIKEKNNE